MSYRVVNLYEVWCDGVTRPGTDDELPCDAEPSDELVWDEETADENAVDNGWQLSGSYSRDMCGLWVRAGRQYR